MTAAHAAGARVAAHIFAEESVAALVRAGVDSVEHGTGLSETDIDEMARRGTALVPTMINIETFGDIAAQAEAKFPGYAAHMRALRDGFPAVVRGGARGRRADLRRHRRRRRHRPRPGRARRCCCCTSGPACPPLDVLRAGSWGAREWLGFPGLVEGGLADLVVYDADPRHGPAGAARTRGGSSCAAGSSADRSAGRPAG